MKMHVDALTGLPDRAALKAAIEGALEAGQGFGLALLDVDHFLEINEKHGHSVGDEVLRALATILGEQAPEGVYRVSGDEFAVLLPGAGLEQAFLRLEGIRAGVEASRQRFGLPDGLAVTVTAGVAEYPRDAKDEPGLMRTVDAALMSAKEGGRNRVGLPPNEEMVMKSCYYSAGSLRKLKILAERLKRKESILLREALDDLLRRYDQR